MEEPIVRVEHLSHRYSVQWAIRDINFEINQKGILGLLGSNGAGKSTLFKLLCGLAFPTQGELRLFGSHAPRDLERQRARVGAIIEQPGFYPALSVEKNLECCRIQKGVPGKDRVARVLDVVGLTYAKGFRCRELSMGMKQRLGLAMALMGLKLWELASLALPMLAILVVQTIFMALYAIFVTWRMMGKNYDAAVLAAGHCGFGLGATPTAIANMQAITERFGPSHMAFLVVPMVGAFFIDIVNALVIKLYLMLPIFAG